MRPGSRALLVLVAALLCGSWAAASAQEGPGAPSPTLVPPVLVEKAPAPYPPAAAAAGIEGTVVLEFTVDDKGETRDVVVKQPAGHGFDEAALEAVKKFRWKPATADGQPVAARVTYAYKFAIKVVPRSQAPPSAQPVTPPVAAEPPVRIQGSVLARGTRAPVAGAHVTAVPADGKSPPVETDTDGAGNFALRGLPAGAWHVVINGPGLVESRFDETVADKTVVTVHYYVDRTWAARYETTVRAAPVREEVSRQTLTTEELVKMPGSFGDALRAIENLPGVARAPFNSGLIIIRGGKPTDSRAYFAGSEVPQLYHFGGFTSVVPAHLVDHIDFFPGNFSVRYGRAIAGTIDLDIREGKRDRFHGYIDTNAFDTGASVEGPIGKGSFILGARRSYIDALIGVAAQVGGLSSVPLSFVTAPVYYDYQAVIDYPLLGGKFRAMALGSDDQLKLLFDNPQGDPTIRGNFSTHIYFHRLQLKFTRRFGDVSLLVQNATGYSGTEGDLGGGLNFAVGAFTNDTRAEVGWKLSSKMRLLFGVDNQLSWTTLGALVPIPAREGEQQLPISASNKYRADERLFIENVGLYAEATVDATDKLKIVPGVRLDWFGDVSSLTFNPRLGAIYKIAQYTTLRAGVGLYSQDPQPQDFDPNFGNPNLRPENAIHYGLSLEQGLLPGLMLEVSGFYKDLYQLVAPSSGTILRDGKSVAERVANAGSGRIYGGELSLRQGLSKWFFGMISYTLMRSERKDCDTCSWHVFDYDQTHVFVMALHANLPRGFEVGVRWRYISGYPYTLIQGGHFDSDGDVYVPGTFPVNNARLDAFHALDIRADKTFVFQRWQLKIYLDLTNIYNSPNQEVIRYSYDYTQKQPVTGLPFIPSFGVRGEF